MDFYLSFRAAEHVKQQIVLQKEKEKCRHDTSLHDLPVIPVGATVAYINKDLKTWSAGRVEQHENQSYVILTEDDRLISCNCVQFQSTNISFLPKSSRLDVPPAINLAQEANKCVSPSNTITNTGQPTINPKPKTKKLPSIYTTKG